MGKNAKYQIGNWDLNLVGGIGTCNTEKWPTHQAVLILAPLAYVKIQKKQNTGEKIVE